MPDEDDDKAEGEGQDSALDQTEQEPVEQDDSADSTDSLPDDPELLKQELKARDEQLRAAKKDAREAKKDAERHKERAEEERKGKEQWYEVAKGKTATPVKTTDTQVQSDVKSIGKQLRAAMKGLDVSEYVVDGEEGMGRLAEVLAERGQFVTLDQVRALLNEHDNQMRQVNIAYQRATKDFPELLKEESPLAQETVSQLEALKTEKPHLGEDDLLDIAIARATRKVGVSAHNGNGKNGKTNHSDTDIDDSTERDRRRRAQGNNGARSNQPAAIVITAQDRAMFAKNGITKDADIRAVKAEAAKLERHAIR